MLCKFAVQTCAVKMVLDHLDEVYAACQVIGVGALV
jgi:hypothetical protein